MALTTSGSRDGERMLMLSNGSSMRFQRPSRTTTGSHTHLIFNPMVTHPTSDVPLLILGGGSFSDTKDHLSSMREERFWKYKVMLILKTETSVLTGNKMVSGNNGTLSMQMNGRVNQEKENLMKILDSTLKEISTSYLK
jgi:hypothetical protein